MNKLFYALSVVLLLSVAPRAHAGFWAKKKTVAIENISTTSVPATVAPTVKPSVTDERATVLKHHVKPFSKIKALIHPDGRRNDSGWEGIVAFICGVLGLVALLPLSIPAIIFGIIGLKRRRHRGLALAGLIMGALGFILLIIYILFIGFLLGFLF